MGNKERAMYEVLGYKLKPLFVRKYFYNVFRFLLYHDREGLFKMLDYRKTLRKESKPAESYLIFKFMLNFLKEKHPRKLFSLQPSEPGIY